MKLPKINRGVHRWASVLIAVPVLLVILTGLLLQLEKEFSWIQPPTQGGTSGELALTFDQILDIAITVPEAELESWDDVDRFDVRPSKGLLKVRGKNRWEIQLDAKTGEILQVAYRRSDFIESLHDGSFFHGKVKLFVFLPSVSTPLRRTEISKSPPTSAGRSHSRRPITPATNTEIWRCSRICSSGRDRTNSRMCLASSFSPPSQFRHTLRLPS